MSLVLITYWRVKEGAEEFVEGFFSLLIKSVLELPGCLIFNITRSRGDKQVFVLFQEFSDVNAARICQLSVSYKSIIEDRITPLLDEYSVTVMEGLNWYQPSVSSEPLKCQKNTLEV